MAYTPTTWASGDTITSTKLNKIEQGIANGGGVFLVNGTYDSSTDSTTLDKTAGEIWSAMQTGMVVIHFNDGTFEYYFPVTSCTKSIEDGSYNITTWSPQYTAGSSSEYPTSRIPK